MKKIEAYQCQFCEKLYISYKTVRIHEHICSYNPSVKSCLNCIWRGDNFGMSGIPCLVKEYPIIVYGGILNVTPKCSEWGHKAFLKKLSESGDNTFVDRLEEHISNVQDDPENFWFEMNVPFNYPNDYEQRNDQK